METAVRVDFMATKTVGDLYVAKNRLSVISFFMVIQFFAVLWVDFWLKFFTWILFFVMKKTFDLPKSGPPCPDPSFTAPCSITYRSPKLIRIIITKGDDNLLWLFSNGSCNVSAVPAEDVRLPFEMDMLVIFAFDACYWLTRQSFHAAFSCRAVRTDSSTPHCKYSHCTAERLASSTKNHLAFHFGLVFLVAGEYFLLKMVRWEGSGNRYRNLHSLHHFEASIATTLYAHEMICWNKFEFVWKSSQFYRRYRCVKSSELSKGYRPDSNLKSSKPKHRNRVDVGEEFETLCCVCSDW